MLNVVIPMSEGEVISDEVLESIDKQTIKCNVRIVRNPLRYDYNQRPSDQRRRTHIIAHSRNLCLRFLRETNVAVMHDSRVIHCKNHNYEDMLELLNQDKIAAVNLPCNLRPWFKLEDLHIPCTSIVARKSLWDNIVFYVPEKRCCMCYSFVDQARSFGMYRYLDLDNTRARKAERSL